MQKRLVLINVGVVIIGLIAAALLAMPLVRNLYLEEFHRTLDSAVMLLTTDGDEIQEDPEAFVQRKREALQQAGQDIRLTVITLDGQVIGETSKDNPTGINPENENHLGRPEVQEALQSGVGFDTRKSESTGETYLYEARVLGDYVLRAAMPVTEMDEATRKLSLFMLAGVCLGGAIVAVVSVVSSRNIVRPMLRLTEATRKVAAGDFESRVPEHYPNEIGQLAQSFNRMAERLTEYRKSTLADIIQGKKYIEAIVNSITEPIIGLDRDRKILFANNEALTILNLKRENVIGKSASELSLRNDLLRRLVRELIQPGEKKEPLKIYADNKESYFQVQYIPIRVSENGEAEEYVGDVILLKNITEFKELDSAKTTFISTISHELKTPISAIMMSLKLLEDARVGAMNDEQKALAESIKESSNRLLEITSELLKMTQVEAGKLQLNPKITKPIELIEYAIKANQVQADRFNCHIEVEYPEKISKLFVDSEKIAWVLTNLLSNAIHYTPENGRIIIGARQQDHSVEIYVQDFGKGIDPRYHQSIFDRYFRVPGTKVQGSGLGLAISKDFVEAHGGTLSVDSAVGKGSTFVIKFNV